MALGDTSQDTTALEDGVRKASSGTGSHDDACEEQHILSPPEFAMFAQSSIIFSCQVNFH